MATDQHVGVMYTDKLTVQEVGPYQMYLSAYEVDPVMAEAGVAWPLVKPILSDNELVARMEFFWDDAQHRRGVVLFDLEGTVIAHVANALLGYNGSGPTLSEQILRHVGVEQDMIDEINARVWNHRPYTVAVSRESIIGDERSLCRSWIWWGHLA